MNPSSLRRARRVLLTAVVTSSLLLAPAAALAPQVTSVPGSVSPAAAPGERPGAYPQTRAVARAAMRETLEATGASSISLALVDGNEIAWTMTVGAIDPDGTRPTASTMYGIGSVSKMFTAVAVMQLVDKGLVSLDAPVVDYVPDFSMASPDYRQITVRMLLNHSAGLPGSDYSNGITTEPYAEYEDQVLRYLSTARLKTTPGSMSVYCNDCFTMAGIVVSRVSGRPFTDYVHEEILAPLGMRHTRYASEGVPAGAYAPVLTESGPLPMEILNLQATGALMSTPTDISRFASMLMNGGSYRGDRILSQRSVDQMGTAQTLTELNPVAPPSFEYGLGWDTVADPALAAVETAGWTKGGDTVHYHAGLTVAPDERLAAVVEGAGPGFSSTAAEELGRRMLLHAMVERGTLAGIPDAITTSGPAERTPTAGRLSSIRGTYLAAGVAVRVVSRSDGSLRLGILSDGSWAFQPDVFTLRTDGSFWSTTTPGRSLRVARAWGRNYLVLDKPGALGLYLNHDILGQRVHPGPALSPAWQARMDRTWLTVNEVPTSFLWATPLVTLSRVPDLPGYVMVTDADGPKPVDPGTSSTVGAMFLVIPTLMGRDLNDLVVVERAGQEWLRYGSTVARPTDGVPVLAGGTSDVAIGAEGYAEWRTIPAGASLALTGASAWKLFDADLAPLTEGSGDAAGVVAPAGAYLAVLGSPGTTARVAAS